MTTSTDIKELLDIIEQQRVEIGRLQQKIDNTISIGMLTIYNYKGLENTDFDYIGSLPPGNYNVYTTALKNNS